MKILIAYVSAGAGHRKAAEAVYYYLQKNKPEIDIRIIDVLEGSNFFFRFFYTKGYFFLVNYALGLWAFAFWLTRLKIFSGLDKTLTIWIDKVCTGNFFKLLARENPDFVISTHFLPSEITAYLKQKGKITSNLITVITDFGVHPFWISPGTDIYAVASGFTAEQLKGMGVDHRRIMVFGIPVDQRFSAGYDRWSLRHKLGLPQEKFTVLLITGSFGLGPIEDICEMLHKDCQVIAVCASNKRLYARMQKRAIPGVKVYGFVNNVEELMAVSDVIITKPGGMTVSEVLAMELPPIFISAIPGQEEFNIQAMASYGIGHQAKDICDIPAIVKAYKSDPRALAEVKARIRQIKKPLAAQELINAICTGGFRPAD
ncbi:MAG: glycosyltransferase [Candidatus Omnitrophica bacterium]|nr:glycosyltransferase [Candidatus Omnitrophota bacterium]